MHAYQNGGYSDQSGRTRQQGIPYNPPDNIQQPHPDERLSGSLYNQYTPPPSYQGQSTSYAEFGVIAEQTTGRKILGILIAIFFGIFTFGSLAIFIDELGSAFGDPWTYLGTGLVMLALMMSGIRLAHNGKRLGNGRMTLTGNNVSFYVPEGKKNNTVQYDMTLQSLQTVTLGKDEVNVTASQIRSNQGYLRGFSFITDSDGEQQIANALQSVNAGNKIWKQ